jgi:hypothetical protein
MLIFKFESRSYSVEPLVQVIISHIGGITRRDSDPAACLGATPAARPTQSESQSLALHCDCESSESG